MSALLLLHFADWRVELGKVFHCNLLDQRHKFIPAAQVLPLFLVLRESGLRFLRALNLVNKDKLVLLLDLALLYCRHHVVGCYLTCTWDIYQSSFCWLQML